MENKKRSRIILNREITTQTSLDNLKYIETNCNFYSTSHTEGSNLHTSSNFNNSNQFAKKKIKIKKKDLLADYQTEHNKKMFITSTDNFKQFKKILPKIGANNNGPNSRNFGIFQNQNINLKSYDKIISDETERQRRKREELAELEEVEKENYDHAQCDDLVTIQLKKEVKSFIKEKLNNLNYWAMTNSKKDGFYSSVENKINYIEDGMVIPNIRNNLFSVNERSIGGVDSAFGSFGAKDVTNLSNRYKRANANLKEKFEHLKHPNTIDKNINLYLNELKRQYQTEKDNLTSIYKISKITDLTEDDFKDRIEKNYLQYYKETDDTFGNIKRENDYFDYFTSKCEKYDKVDFAETRVRNVILKIDPKSKVKNLARKIFGIFLNNKFDDIKGLNLEEIIEEHIKNELLHKKCRIVANSGEFTGTHSHSASTVKLPQNSPSKYPSNKSVSNYNKSPSGSVTHSRQNSMTKYKTSNLEKSELSQSNLKSFNTMKNILKIIYNDGGDISKKSSGKPSSKHLVNQ